MIALLSASAAPGQGAGPAAPAAKPAAAPSARPASPAAAPAAHLPGYNADRNAYFGDLHVHTGLSFDAYGYNVRLAGGPLDFTAVTDHSEYMGSMREANDPQRPLSKNPLVQGLFS